MLLGLIESRQCLAGRGVSAALAGSATAPADFPYNTTALFAGSGEWVNKKDM
jgi:hypothetical protein